RHTAAGSGPRAKKAGARPCAWCCRFGEPIAGSRARGVRRGPLPALARPALRVAHPVLVEHPPERRFQVDPLLIGERDDDEEDVGQLERQVLLGLAGLLRLVAVAVVQLAGELADLLDEAR